MKPLEPCKCGASRYLMANGAIWEGCDCSKYQDAEEELESQRRAEEEKRHEPSKPDVEDPTAG